MVVFCTSHLIGSCRKIWKMYFDAKKYKRIERIIMEKGYVKLLLTSSVCAAIIAGVFSLATVRSTNQIAKEIEAMKYEYSLHQETYKRIEGCNKLFYKV